jgi:hypothetical protein
MSHIVLTAEQARVVREASGLVEVRDEAGQILASFLSPVEAAIVAEAKRRLAAAGPRYPMAEVRARLQKLEAISQHEALDSARVKELLDRMRAGENV